MGRLRIPHIYDEAHKIGHTHRTRQRRSDRHLHEHRDGTVNPRSYRNFVAVVCIGPAR